jgi:uncharacterized membrane-anchored protein
MKTSIMAFGFGCGCALALLLGNTLTVDDMAVVLGVAVGVAASVPVSLLLVALVQRAQRPPDPTLHRLPTVYVHVVAEPQPLQLPARRQP